MAESHPTPYAEILRYSARVVNRTWITVAATVVGRFEAQVLAHGPGDTSWVAWVGGKAYKTLATARLVAVNRAALHTKALRKGMPLEQERMELSQRRRKKGMTEVITHRAQLAQETPAWAQSL